VKVFEKKEAGYRRWMHANQNGFVLNYDVRNPGPGYLKLHHASCRTIQPRPPRNWTNWFGKACRTSRAELETMARRWGGEADERPHCFSN
jgi:hypothetical protein